MNAERFERYIVELQHFSATHAVPCGSPEDIPLLLVRLDGSETFREECASMLRSVFYREHGELPPSEILMLLIVAWGGLPAASPQTSLQEPIAHLQKFASAVLRTSLGPPELPSDQEADLQFPPTTALSKADQAPPNLLDHDAPSLGEMPSTPEQIQSAIQQLIHHSPDVKLYLHLLQRCSAQTSPQPNAELGLQTEPAPATPVQRPTLTPEPAILPPRDDPWAENSDLQIQLRRFAARRDARRAYEATAASRPIHAKALFAAETALTRLLGRRRPV